MPGPLDPRLDRVEGRRMAAAAERGSEAIRRRRIWRAEAAMGAVIRSALAIRPDDAFKAQPQCRRVAGERQFDGFAGQRLAFPGEQ